MFSTKNSLMSKFAIYSFIAFVATGILLAVVISMHIRANFAEYMPELEFEKHISSINLTISIIGFLGLTTLYFLLLRIIHNASKTLVEQNQNLIQQKNEIENTYVKLQNTYKDTMVTLSRAVDVRDPYTARHSERVAAISSKIAEKLGVGKKELEQIELVLCNI